MAVRAYAGSARPVNDAYEGKAGFRVVEVDEADGSLSRGYEEIATGRLIGLACMVVSPARQTALNALNAAETTAATNKANMFTRLEELFVKARDHAQNPVNPALTTRELNESIARLIRVVKQLHTLT